MDSDSSNDALQKPLPGYHQVFVTLTPVHRYDGSPKGMGVKRGKFKAAQIEID